MAVSTEEVGILQGDEPDRCIDVMVQRVLNDGRQLDFRDLAGPVAYLRYELERKYREKLDYDFSEHTFNIEKFKNRLLDNPLVDDYLPQMSDPSNITEADFYAWVGEIIPPFQGDQYMNQGVPEEQTRDVLNGFRAFYLILHANGPGVIDISNYFDIYKRKFEDCVGEVVSLDLVDMQDGKYEAELKAVIEKVNELVEFHEQRPTFSHGEFLHVMHYFASHKFQRAVIEGMHLWSDLRPGY